MNPFLAAAGERVAALGESRLITALHRWLGRATPAAPAGMGDDCAVLPPTGEHPLLITTDPVVYGRHFDDSVTPEAAGAKLLKRNLSDIAAMGGEPLCAVISLALPPQTAVRWVQRFYRGLRRASLQYGVPIVGGDVSQSPPEYLGAHLTLVGRSAGRILRRTGAGLGDLLLLTGSVGGSILGQHLRFEPRLAEGRWLAARSEVTAMIDVSDGLAKDLAYLVPPRAVAAVVTSSLPVRAAARRLAQRTGRPVLEHVATDGEDYELLFTLKEETDFAAFARAWTEAFGYPLHPIGQLVEPERLPGVGPIRSVDGGIDWSLLQGYEHLRAEPAAPARRRRPR